MRQLVHRVTIRDCEIETFRVGGGGGQRRDKVETGVRIRHRPSGAVGEARESRRQIDNKRAAFRRMGESPAFQRWARVQAGVLDAAVESALAPEHLKVEVRRWGRWVEL